MSYAYRMIQIPPSINIRERDESGREAARYLETVVNQNAQGGWEFYRVDEIGVRTNPGCLAMIFGSRPTYINYYVVTFRRPISAPPPRLEMP